MNMRNEQPACDFEAGKLIPIDPVDSKAHHQNNHIRYTYCTYIHFWIYAGVCVCVPVQHMHHQME